MAALALQVLFLAVQLHMLVVVEVLAVEVITHKVLVVLAGEEAQGNQERLVLQIVAGVVVVLMVELLGAIPTNPVRLAALA
jgi:hypothetical protein